MALLKSEIDWCRRIQYLQAGLLIGVFVLFYFGGYRPQNARAQAVQQEISQKQQQLEVKKQEALKIPYVAQDLADLNAKLGHFKKLPGDPQLGEFMRDITEVSKQSQLKNLEFNFSGSPRRSEQFTELPVSLKFEGDFVSIFNFLRAAEDLPRLTRVSNLAIRGENLKTGVVQVEMSMSIYFSEGS